jgi:Asp-tRNA(Asn)/Glu-tRNA(Gln) amidotransferase A subunit family amidase
LNRRREGSAVNEILFESATEVAKLLRRWEVSSRELTELVLAQIEAVKS